jgi:hypothetical protein
MEPGSAASQPSPEMVPSKTPEAPVKGGEATPVSHHEHAPAHHEKAETHHGGGHGHVAHHVAQQPTLPAPQQAVATSQPTSDDVNPTTAADEDLVEKEWVDKAKKIVSETKDDPYKQGKEISKLQADYLKKRYGKDIKLSGD